MLGRMHVEINNANMCTATRRVVHTANNINSGVGRVPPSQSLFAFVVELLLKLLPLLLVLLLFNWISTTAT